MKVQPAGYRHGVQRLSAISFGAPGLDLDESTHPAGQYTPKRTDRYGTAFPGLVTVFCETMLLLCLRYRSTRAASVDRVNLIMNWPSQRIDVTEEAAYFRRYSPSNWMEHSTIRWHTNEPGETRPRGGKSLALCIYWLEDFFSTQTICITGSSDVK